MKKFTVNLDYIDPETSNEQIGLMYMWLDSNCAEPFEIVHEHRSPNANIIFESDKDRLHFILSPFYR